MEVIVLKKSEAIREATTENRSRQSARACHSH